MIKITQYGINEMETYGGSLVKALANAWQHADPINKRKLETTFPYFEEYEKKTIKRAQSAQEDRLKDTNRSVNEIQTYLDEAYGCGKPESDGALDAFNSGIAQLNSELDEAMDREQTKEE